MLTIRHVRADCTLYVNKSTATRVKVTVWPETSASIAALGVVLVAEPAT